MPFACDKLMAKVWCGVVWCGVVWCWLLPGGVRPAAAAWSQLPVAYWLPPGARCLLSCGLVAAVWLHQKPPRSPYRPNHEHTTSGTHFRTFEIALCPLWLFAAPNKCHIAGRVRARQVLPLKAHAH